MMRSALSDNSIIELNHINDENRTRRFSIKKVLGSGASCIAYEAIDIDNSISIIIKECFPHCAVARKENGTIIWKSPNDEVNAKERFIDTCEKQRQIQTSEGTRHTSTHMIDGLHNGNNTLYSISGMHCIETYDTRKDLTLQDIFITARAVARAVNRYHERGWLYLDIKPQNILMDPDTLDKIWLLDFDSIIKITDVKNYNVTISYTHGYAAPELLQGKSSKICEATDIYSIGAMMFNRIMNRVPTASDICTFSDWDFTEIDMFNRLSSKTLRLTKELLRKALSVSIHNRFQNSIELISALDELINESAPNKIFLKNSCPTPVNYFVGRYDELNQIQSAFKSGKKVVFLHGMGGCGKTEVALN